MCDASSERSYTIGFARSKNLFLPSKYGLLEALLERTGGLRGSFRRQDGVFLSN